MPTLPSDYLSVIGAFAPLFSSLVWQHAQVLLLGAILTPGHPSVPGWDWTLLAYNLV